MWRRQVFFKQELHAISGWLQQSEWAHSCGSPTILHASDHLALQPNGVSDRCQQDKQDQRDLDDGNDDVGGDCQFVS